MKQSLPGPVIALISLLFWVALFEGASRLWISHRGDPLDHAMQVLRADAALGWRQKSGLDTRFYGQPLHTDADGFRKHRAGARWNEASLKVLVLGPSSAFGWGVGDEETYSALLASRLDTPARRSSVFNAGQIGFSTWQGLRLYEQGLRELKPDLVLIAYGVNDVDRHRFFFDSPSPDKEELVKTRKSSSVTLQNLMGELTFVRTAARALRAFSKARPTDEGVLRVSFEDLRANFARMVQIARQEGAGVILIGTPYWMEDYRQARQSVRPERAAELERLSTDLPAINAAVNEVAAQMGVAYYDAQRALNELGQSAFVDPVHPSAQGHLNIAEDLVKIVAAMEIR